MAHTDTAQSPPWAKHVGCGEAITVDSPDGLYQPTLPLSGAKWQLDGRQAAAMTACRVGWHDCCLPASERSGLVIATEVGIRYHEKPSANFIFGVLDCLCLL